MFTDRSVLAEISNAKNEMLTPKAYQTKYAGDFRREKIGQVYELYQRRLKENNAIDFDDIINYTIKNSNNRSRSTRILFTKIQICISRRIPRHK